MTVTDVGPANFVCRNDAPNIETVLWFIKKSTKINKKPKGPWCLSRACRELKHRWPFARFSLDLDFGSRNRD